MQRSFIYRAIDKIVSEKEKKGIHPARATWRELRDVLKEEHWPLLDELVELDRVKKYDSINYPTYEVNWRQIHADEAWLKRVIR
jgi:hypothetical protein